MQCCRCAKTITSGVTYMAVHLEKCVGLKIKRKVRDNDGMSRHAYRVVSLKRNGQGYEVDGFLYRVGKRSADGSAFYLRCLSCKSGCPAAATLDNKCGEVVISNPSHNHSAPNLAEIQFFSDVKVAAALPSLAKHSLPKAFETARSDFLKMQDYQSTTREETILQLPSFGQVRGTLYRSRNSLFERSPKSIAEIDFGDKRMLNTEAGECFLIGDTGSDHPDRIIAFSSRSNLLQHLVDADQVFVDGTFWTVPFIYKQLFTMHAFVYGQQFPLVYILLNSKQSQAYQKAFRLVENAVSPHILKVTKWVSDFETGLLDAIKKIFPNGEIRGCFFHFAQCVHRNVAKLGFASLYQNYPEFRIAVRSLIALGLLPAADKQSALDSLRRHYQNRPEFVAVLDQYFVKTWMRSATRDLEMWDWHLVSVRTNNNVESFHSSFNKAVTTPNLGFFKFIVALMEQHESQQIKLTQRENGFPLPPKNKVYERLNDRLKRIQEEYRQRPILNYLRALAYCVPEADRLAGQNGADD